MLTSANPLFIDFQTGQTIMVRVSEFLHFLSPTPTLGLRSVVLCELCTVFAFLSALHSGMSDFLATALS